MAHSKYPLRAPLVVADALLPYVENKNYCELGTCAGDIMLAVSKHTTSAIGIEYDAMWHSQCLEKGLNVILGDFTKIEIPKADVYYLWAGDQLTKFNIIQKPSGLWILGQRPNESYEVDFDPELIVNVPFQEYNIVYDYEEVGIFKLLIKYIG